MRTIDNVVAAIDYIEARLGEPLSLGTVAERLGYSRYYLHRLFTKTVGLTMKDYLSRRRLTEAAKLLVFSEEPIMEIALRAGYESQQAFSSVFKALYKLPPRRFRENQAFYPLQMRFAFDEAAVEAASKEKARAERAILSAREADVPDWLRLTRLVIDGFPCLDEDEHTAALRRHIAENGALVLREGGIALGIMMISRRAGSIDFLGVHPLHRSRGIGHALLAKAAVELTGHTAISITTYREGDKADTGHRKALKEFGFAEREFLVEFGYPTQKMTIPAKAPAFKDASHA